MLQYILSESERFSVGELTQMAIEGGCLWINLSLPNVDSAQIRTMLVPDVIAMCRESGTILTIDDRPELARDLGLHGVRFTAKYFVANPTTSPVQLRELLGPEAIIGVETADVSSLNAIVNADADFICLPANLTLIECRQFIDNAHAQNVAIPIVAQGNINADNVAQYLSEGFSGIAIERQITDAEDPTQELAKILNAISA